MRYTPGRFSADARTSARRTSAGRGPEKAHCGWALGVEAQWLRLVLEVWAEAEDLRT